MALQLQAINTLKSCSFTEGAACTCSKSVGVTLE